MDWNLAIEKNREALKRILAMLVAMVEVAGNRPATLPRHLHRFVLRLLRPAEAAARRLIIVAARGLVVDLSPPRIAKPKPTFVRNGLGIAIVLAQGSMPDRVRAPVPKRTRAISLPLLDPLKRWGGRRYPKQRSMPRISFFDSFDRPRHPDPPLLSPDDPLDAGRLHRRLEAIGRALDDLPRQAKRLARWRARAGAQGINRDAIRIQRLSPMRPGRPPGWRHRPNHAVYEVLNELHGLAIWARESPDTS